MSHFGVPHTVNHAASGALRRNGKAAMSRIDRSKSRSAGGKGFYIALALCLAAVGAIGYFTPIRPVPVPDLNIVREKVPSVRRSWNVGGQTRNRAVLRIR